MADSSREHDRLGGEHGDVRAESGPRDLAHRTADLARKAAWVASRTLRAEGLNLLDVVIGPPDPMDAIASEHASRGRAYQSTVVSTLPLGASRWLKRDLPNRLRSELGIDVVHVISRAPAHAGA